MDHEKKADELTGTAVYTAPALVELGTYASQTTGFTLANNVDAFNYLYYP